jgi:septum formation protein
MVQPTLILASGSPRRQELIRTFGLAVRIDPADVDESMPEGTPPDVLVEQLSLRKAQAVSSRGGHEEGGIVIGSDTVVVLDGRILGKPRDERDAIDMLRALAGRTHRVYTGIACIGIGLPDKAGYDGTAADVRFGDLGQYRTVADSTSGHPLAILGHTVSSVTFRPMSDEEIAAYVKTGEPLDKAGSYGVQGLGAVFVETIVGDFYGIMGLPLNLLYTMLLRLGVRFFDHS